MSQQLLQPSEKHRNQHLQMAHDIVRIRRLENYQPDAYKNAYGVMHDLLDLSQKYVDEVQQKAVVLKNKLNDRIMVIPYYTRFSPEYYQMPFEKLRSLDIDEAIFLTLTVDPKMFGCLHDAHKGLVTGWNKLKTAILKTKGHAVGWKGDYVSVIEFQQKSTKMPHMHILLVGCSWLDVVWVRGMWEKYQNGRILHVKHVKTQHIWKDGHEYYNKPISYLLKYMQKYVDNREHLTALWALNGRAYATSQGLIEKYTTSPIFKKKDEHFKLFKCVLEYLLGKVWVFMGVFEYADAKDWRTYQDLVYSLT